MRLGSTFVSMEMDAMPTSVLVGGAQPAFLWPFISCVKRGSAFIPLDTLPASALFPQVQFLMDSDSSTVCTTSHPPWLRLAGSLGTYQWRPDVATSSGACGTTSVTMEVAYLDNATVCSRCVSLSITCRSRIKLVCCAVL